MGLIPNVRTKRIFVMADGQKGTDFLPVVKA